MKFWRDNPNVDHLIGGVLSKKYRFQEGARHQRRALVYDEQFLPAKSQLTTDLLRLGNELEGWKLADEVYDKDSYNIFAHNLLTLRDSLANFATIEQDGFIVRMSHREAEIYGSQVLRLIKEAEQKLSPKYEFEIEKPVVIEIFPRQQDFAIRTFGLPGGAGYLGVCFGRVITMNSPASPGSNPQNWKSVLWHEFCHVVTLQKTRNKMPRWLSEGISVYEEAQEDASWGQAMTARYREMILGDDLTPVSELSGAFLSPPTPEHLQFAYFESALVVDYLIETYGLPMLNRVLTDLGMGMPINESLGRYTGSVKLLDKEFAEHARKLASEFAVGIDLSRNDLEPFANLQEAAQWAQQNPKHFFGQLLYAQQLISAEQWEKAQALVDQLIEMYPQFASANSPYHLAAQIAQHQNDSEKELQALQAIAQRNARDLDSLLRICELTAAKGDWQATIDHSLRAQAINPMIPAPHRWAAMAAEQSGNDQIAVASLRALSQMNPLDPADLHFRLAQRLVNLKEFEAARREVLKALEHAPRFRQAHRLLLSIVERDSQPTESTSDDLEPQTKPLSESGEPPQQLTGGAGEGKK